MLPVALTLLAIEADAVLRSILLSCSNAQDYYGVLKTCKFFDMVNPACVFFNKKRPARKGRTFF